MFRLYSRIFYRLLSVVTAVFLLERSVSMSAIGGFYHYGKNFMEREEYYHNLLKRFNRKLRHRGPDDSGTYLSAHCGLSQTRLATSELEPSQDHIHGVSLGHEPAFLREGDFSFALVMDGEIYNKEELKSVFPGSTGQGNPLSGASLLLSGYLAFGPDFINYVNGAFSIAIYDQKENSLYLFRDRLGIKPLFYTKSGEDFLFASEIKALFEFPGITAKLDKDGLNQVFSIGPARTPGNGIFQGIREVRPGHFLKVTPEGTKEIRYWQLKSLPHEDSYEKTIEKTAFLIEDAIKRQLEADVPVCSLLSGGVDSSLVSAICARELKKKNRQLTTYSFDFQDSEKHFKANAFQPSLDAPYVKIMAEYLDSDHHILTCDSKQQFDGLFHSIDAHDLPNMADVDSSLLYFCSLVSENHKVALTGECADEVFGGYPWFHKPEFLNADTFPWTMDLNARKVLLKDDVINDLDMEEYVANTYETAVEETPLLEGESEEAQKRRRLSYLNLRWFMQTLLNRMDRDSGSCGLAARVPFADYRLVEYIWNVPWDMKARNGMVKGLLREAGRGLLPDEILFRKKSPYPKTYDTAYESMLVRQLNLIMADPSSPILRFLDPEKVKRFLKSPSDYGKPWYGQLMAAPQMMAYMIQVNDWLRKYRITI